MKVNVTLNDELLKRIDSFAEENFMTRSGLISVAVSQYLSGHAVTGALKELAICMRKIADSNEMDEESMQKLEEFRTLVKYLPITLP